MSTRRSEPDIARGTRRLFVVAPSSSLGGSQVALAALLRLLPDKGWEPVVVLLEPGPLENWIIDLGFEVLVLNPHRTRDLRRTISTIKRLAALIRSSDALVVFSNESKGHVFGGLAALIARRPAVFWQHGVPGASPLERIAARVPAASIVAGSEVSARAQRALSGSTPVVKIPPGIDLAAVAARSGAGMLVRASLGWNVDDRVVGIAGRLQAWKGQRTFLEAALLLAQKDSRVRFLIVGGSSATDHAYEAELRKLASADKALVGRVHFSGSVEADHVHDWIDAMDVVTHCSFGEPFGIVILEAMALGKPLIAAASGGPLEIVQDGTSGLLVPPGDPAALAAAVSRLLRQPDLAAKLSNGALQRVQAFDEQRTAEKFSGVFDQVAARDTPARYREVVRTDSEVSAETADLETTTPAVLAIGLESCSSRSGGLNRYFGQLVAALGELGTPITGLVTGDVKPDDDEFLEIVAPAMASLLVRFRAIASAVKRHAEADIVDAHFPLTALPALFGRPHRQPFVVHFHGPWADESASAGEGRLACEMKRLMERFVFSRADAFVVLSRAFRRVLIERYGVSPWDTHVIPPGVDTETLTPGDRSKAREALGFPPDAFVALAVRRLVPRMGLDVLLEAWAELVRSAEGPVVLCIVGVGPQRDVLEEQAIELGLAGVVRFAGWVDDEELVHYYQAADVSIVPSVALEGYGLVVLESLASGTPVVASELDGLIEALEELASDLLVPPGNPGALADRLRGALTGVQPLPTAEACRQYAEGFSWAKVARRHVQLYRHLAERRREDGTVVPRSLRVVVLGHTAQLSGAELALLRIVPALTDVQVHVILAQDGPLVSLLEHAGASVEVLPLGEQTRNLRRDRVRPSTLPIVASAQSVVYVLRLARRLAQVHPDIVHTNSLKAALYGGMAARLAGVPCVWHVRDRIADDYLPSSAVRLVQRAARLLPNAIIANSHATLETLSIRTNGNVRVVHDLVGTVTPSETHIASVIPSPVVLPPLELIRRASPSSNLRIAMVGRLSPWKGQDVYLRAFAKAFPHGNEVAVLVGSALFGEDDYECQLHELVGDLGIAERVEFRGFCSDVFEELRMVDALVHASVIPEPFGQVVIEGMAAGLPVVASRAGGPAEILVEGETGLLYPPGDVDALAHVLGRLAGDADLRSRLGIRARAATEAYSPERVAVQIVDVYEQVLANRHQGAASAPEGSIGHERQEGATR